LVPQTHLAPKIHAGTVGASQKYLEPASDAIILADLRGGHLEPVAVEPLRRETAPALFAWRAHSAELRSHGLIKASEGEFFPFGIVPENIENLALQKRLASWHLATEIFGPAAFWVWILVLLAVLAGAVALFVHRHALARAAGWAAAGLMAYVPLTNLVLLVAGWTSGAFHTPLGAAMAYCAVDLASLATLFFLAHVPQNETAS